MSSDPSDDTLGGFRHKTGLLLNQSSEPWEKSYGMLMGLELMEIFKSRNL